MLNVLYANDKPGEYPQSYYAATATPLDPFPDVKGDIKTDVCIIGAGFSGLSAALHLRKKGYEVALLDAHRVGWGASGRNGGQINSGQRLEQEALIKLVGDEHARDLWELSEAAKHLVLDLIKENNIECDLRSGIIHANHKAHYGEETAEHVKLMNEHYGYKDYRYLDQEELRSLLATTAYYNGSFDAAAWHLHPLRYVLGLAKACRDLGVDIYERSEVVELEETSPARIRTQSGSVTAEHVIVAANGYVGALSGKIAERVMPINNYIIATEPLPEETASSLIANNAAVADSKFVINYYRLSDDRRMVFGGRESYRYKFPDDIKSYVRTAMLKIYPQLENTRIDYGWGGTLAITINRMPYFDWLAPNIATVGGYSGHGVAMATMGGALAAEAVAGSAERFDLMARVPSKTIPGGRHARIPLLALAMAFYSIRDRLG